MEASEAQNASVLMVSCEEIALEKYAVAVYYMSMKCGVLYGLSCVAPHGISSWQCLLSISYKKNNLRPELKFSKIS